MNTESKIKILSKSDSIFSNNESIKEYDSELWSSMENESTRQEEHIELIASENYASTRILEAQGSVLTNKYAEGYPSKRYYGGCEYVDIAEELAISRAKELFKADYANVQPHSGSSANAAAFLALLEPNDTILGMSLDHGGHLTHGAKVNFSGKNYKGIQYGLHPETNEIDYDQVRKLAHEHRPKLIIAGFSAYSGIIDWKIFREIADEVNAYFLVDMAHISGLVAAELYPSPIPFADVVTSTTHKTLRGPRSGIILARKNEVIEKKLNSAVFPGSQGGPLMHVVAAKAVCFKEALEPEFKTYIKQVMENAKVMCSTIQSRGINVVTGKTENHIILVDLRNKEITGKELEKALGDVNITVNKNAVPDDPRSPFVTSGVRLGTPAVTTRGFKEEEVEKISNWICDVIENHQDISKMDEIKNSVIELTTKYPVYNLQMYCPFCQADDTKVIDSRLVADGSQTRRRRSCEVCHSRFTTFETADLALPRVIKSNGERQPFNGSKLKRGMLRALEKRPLSSEEIDTAFGKILTEIRTSGVREIQSIKIGEFMMNTLKEVDTVAYVRFASVYRDFQDIKDFSAEITSLSKEKPSRKKTKK